MCFSSLSGAGVETLGMLGKCSTMELPPQTQVMFTVSTELPHGQNESCHSAEEVMHRAWLQPSEGNQYSRCLSFCGQAVSLAVPTIAPGSHESLGA